MIQAKPRLRTVAERFTNRFARETLRLLAFALTGTISVSASNAQSTDRIPATTTGTASYYSAKYHGRQTANGEIYDMHRLTAAHRTLPFGTLVKVTNLTNLRSVVVRVNDRGPFISGRMIDLSWEAAQTVDMVQGGVTTVRLEVERPSQGPAARSH